MYYDTQILFTIDEFLTTLLDSLCVEFTIIYITIHQSHCTIDEFHTLFQ